MKNYIINKILLKFDNKIIKIFISILAGIKLNKLSSNCKKLEHLINLAFSYEYPSNKEASFKIQLNASQNKKELFKFCKIIARFRPKVIIEIGTLWGGPLFLLSKLSSQDALIISIDLPSGKFGGGYSRLRIPFYKLFAKKKQKIILLRKDSHLISTFLKIKKKIKNKKVDLLFIDGDHHYEGVKQDFEMYNSLVKKNGIIAFHDIVVHSNEKDCQVNKFWNEIKNEYDYKEIVEDWNQKNYGIGIIIQK